MRIFRCYNLIVGLLFLVTGLMGCRQDECGDNSDPLQHLKPLIINVCDNGYGSLDNMHTRALESDYVTTFISGDRIGIFAVKNGEIVNNVNNLCFIAENVGNNISWKTEQPDLLLPVDATYFAYYPYQESLPGLSAETNATSFFANIVSNWNPNKNQRTYIDYTAQDLMIADGIISDGKLSFSMKHCMALVVLDLPKTIYQFENNEVSISDYIVPAKEVKFQSFTPCRMNDGKFRYLIKPSTDISLSGSYVDAFDKTLNWDQTINIPENSYKTYTVDGGTVTNVSHNLQIGDFYMKDGTLLGKAETLSDAQKANCIGIVFCIDDNRIGEGEKTALGGTAHGLVMALTNWGNYSWGDKAKNEDGDPFVNKTKDNLSKMYNDIEGYSKTYDIIGKIKRGVYSTSTYGAFNAVRSYGASDNASSKYTAPDHTTGWFLPSIGQWWDILRNLGNLTALDNYKESAAKIYRSNEAEGGNVASSLNAFLKNAGGGDTFHTSIYFWSSSEFSNTKGCYINFSYYGYVDVDSYDKDYGGNSVRCVLAF